MANERRTSNMLREVIIPTVTAVIVGSGSSYIAMERSTAVMQERMRVFERDLNATGNILVAVQANQLELAARGQWMTSTNLRIKKLQNEIRDVEHRVLREVEIRHDGGK